MGLSALACLFLVAGAASADRYKNESWKGKGKHNSRHYEQRYSGYGCDGRHYSGGYDHYGGGRSYRGSNTGWSVGGHWEGAHGGVSGQVWGGHQRYPSHGRYERRHRHYSGCGHGSYYSGGGHYRHHSRPPGHLPPPGACRVWFYDRPAGHQPPPSSCREAEHYAYHHGGEVIYGGPHR